MLVSLLDSLDLDFDDVESSNPGQDMNDSLQLECIFDQNQFLDLRGADSGSVSDGSLPYISPVVLQTSSASSHSPEQAGCTSPSTQIQTSNLPADDVDIESRSESESELPRLAKKPSL